MNDAPNPLAELVKIIELTPEQQKAIERKLIERPSGVSEERLRTWVLELSAPSRGKLACPMFTLSLMTRGTLEQRSQRPLPKKYSEEEREEFAQKLAEEWAHSMTTWAEGSAGVQTFVIGAHLSESQAAHAYEQIPFTAYPKSQTLGPNHDVADETKIPQVVGHLQRLVDSMYAKMSSNYQVIFDRDQTIIDKQWTRIDQLEASRWDMTLKHEALADAHALRHVQTVKTTQDIQLQHEVTLAALQYGKTLLDRYLGANPILEAMKKLRPDQLLAFWDNLDEEQRQAFKPVAEVAIASLPEENRAAVAQLLGAGQTTPEETPK